MRAKLGDRVKILACGLDEGRFGTVVDRNYSHDANVAATEYPFVGGRTPESMKWSLVLMNDGKVSGFPTRLLEVQVSEHIHSEMSANGDTGNNSPWPDGGIESFPEGDTK